MTITPRTRHLLAALALTGAVTATACTGLSGPDSSEASKSDSRATAADASGGYDAAPPGAAAEADLPAAGTVDKQLDDAAAPPDAALIRTGTVSLEARDVAEARFDVHKIVDQHHGTVTDEESTSDDGTLASLRVVMRVPSGQFAQTVTALEKVGALTSSTAGSEDVTTEVIDVAARLRAQERSVRRVEALLDRAINLTEIVRIESELSRRQADLDSLKARHAWLEDQTSLSTITVHVERPDSDATQEDDTSGFLDGLGAGWNSFADGMVAASTALGFALPWMLALGFVGAPVWLWLRGGRRRTTPDAPVAGTGAGA